MEYLIVFSVAAMAPAMFAVIVTREHGDSNLTGGAGRYAKKRNCGNRKTIRASLRPFI